MRLTAYLALTASFVTDTRVATLALMAGLLVYLVTMPALHRVAVAVWAFEAAALVFAVAFPKVFALDRLLASSSLLDFRTGTGASRVESWRIALGDLDLSDWLFGSARTRSGSDTGS